MNYGSDPEKVKKVVMKAIKKVDVILDDPEPRVRFLEMGDYALKFKVYFWVPKYTERFSTKEEVRTIIYNALNKAGIGIPFPTQTIYLNNAGKKK